MSIDNSGTNPYPTDQDLSLVSLSTNATDGAGGGDMAIYSEPREPQLRGLVSGSYTNNSSLTLPSGVVDTQNYSVKFDGDGEIASVQLSTEAEDGAGGGEMAIYSEPREVQLRSLVSGTFTNNTSVTIPSGVVDTQNYTVRFDGDGEKASVQLSSESESGDGGGTMGVWFEDRTAKLERLVSGSYVNDSEFSIPSAVVSTQNYNTTFANSERWFNVAVAGQTKGGDGLPLSGTASIQSGENVEAQKSVQGSFQLASGAPDGVESGSDVSGEGSARFEFIPQAGFTFEDDQIDRGLNEVVIEYGSVTGTVTDYNGDPVTNDELSATLQLTGETVPIFTDANGEYSSSAPGGNNVTVESLGANVTQSVSITAVQETVLDIQYSGLEITLLTPNNSRLSDASVSFDSTFKRTDSDGKVTFVQVPALSNINVTIYREINEAIQSADQGVLKQAEVTVGLAVTGQVLDDGEPVAGLDVRLLDESGREYVGRTSQDGTFNVGAPTTGTVSVVFGREDRRYTPSTEEFTVERNKTVKQNARMSRERNSGTI